MTQQYDSFMWRARARRIPRAGKQSVQVASPGVRHER
ncbi:hypothetical protein AARI_02890 [Glutamicibacter arilaitensis Re117]|uniref:Uncharacterized protein n=1 Tax=Glutamicibacter arilaitensis (strain DSM 16368 / CIP 108037 / IAM 15318 / JCM 13566 / NCIMB 14258 / Re117) TaxID=861360 RepID=A0ABM9PTJ6_GLUAR|nr:hypothetical protein AARI_02890 [Glutamicibacter arilaitensis Re117]